MGSQSKKCSRFYAAVAIFLAAALVAVMVPILLAGDCAHPFGDDYAFSIHVHQALEEGSSAVGAMIYTAVKYYGGWQGTYAAVALMSLQPGVWSEQAYLLTSVVMLLMIVLPTACLMHVILRRWMGLSVWEWIAASAGISIVTILYQPSVTQAFFWWNGAAFYTFFYGLMLLLITCMLRLRLAPSHPRLLFAAAVVLAPLVGGGNYVTALFTCLLLWGYALICLIWDRKRLWQPVSVGVILTVCFLISALSPGNRVRQAMNTGMGVSESIFQSVIQVLKDSSQWINLPILCFYLCMIPLLWKGLGRVRFSFPWPAAVTLLLVLAMASQNTPHFFALAEEGPGRLRNIVFDSWIWLLLVGGAYWIGWLRHRAAPHKEMPPALAKTVVTFGLVLLLAAVGLHFPTTSTGQCVQALSDGSAREYDRHMNGWIELLNGPEADVVLPQVEDPPKLLYMFNITGNPDIFANTAAANYYGKNSVVALPADEIAAAPDAAQ